MVSIASYFNRYSVVVNHIKVRRIPSSTGKGKHDESREIGVTAHCSQNTTIYTLSYHGIQLCNHRPNGFTSCPARAAIPSSSHRWSRPSMICTDLVVYSHIERDAPLCEVCKADCLHLPSFPLRKVGTVLLTGARPVWYNSQFPRIRSSTYMYSRHVCRVR